MHLVPREVADKKKAAQIAYLVNKLVLGQHDHVHHEYLSLSKIAFKRVKSAPLNMKLVQTQAKLNSTNFKFGVLFAPSDKCNEDDMYAVDSSTLLTFLLLPSLPSSPSYLLLLTGFNICLSLCICSWSHPIACVIVIPCVNSELGVG